MQTPTSILVIAGAMDETRPRLKWQVGWRCAMERAGGGDGTERPSTEPSSAYR